MGRTPSGLEEATSDFQLC